VPEGCTGDAGEIIAFGVAGLPDTGQSVVACATASRIALHVPGTVVTIPATPIAPSRIGLGTLPVMDLSMGGMGPHMEQQFLVTWLDGVSGAPRAMASEVRGTGAGVPLASWEASAAVPVSTASRGDHAHVVAVGLNTAGRGGASGGTSITTDSTPNVFVTAWGDGDGDVRGVVLAADGILPARPPARLFANPACDVAEFVLPRASQGDQHDIAVAVLGEGFVAAWTDRGGNGADASGAGVRLAYWHTLLLLPLE
jgi:hypothetical protein